MILIHKWIIIHYTYVAGSGFITGLLLKHLNWYFHCFLDECTVQLDHHGRLCFRQEKEPQGLKQRPKHPAKIYIWGGISTRGATRIIMSSGTMNAIKYDKIIEAGLVPFVRTFFPDRHRLQQDNDPKHSSKYISRLLSSMAFIGEKPLLSHQTLTQLRIAGVL